MKIVSLIYIKYMAIGDTPFSERRERKKKHVPENVNMQWVEEGPSGYGRAGYGGMVGKCGDQNYKNFQLLT